MIRNIQNIKKAREMRLEGRSLSEINKEIHIPRSTLSTWLRDISLTKEQVSSIKHRVSTRMSRGRMNSSIILKSRRMFREKQIFDEAEKDFTILAKDAFFLMGLALYWSNGAKKGNSFQFSTSDMSMILIMAKWIKKYLNVEDMLIKRRNYKGYYRLDISRVDVLRKVIAWQKLLIKYYDKELADKEQMHP